jgi:hypothetical protein
MIKNLLMTDFSDLSIYLLLYHKSVQTVNEKSGFLFFSYGQRLFSSKPVILENDVYVQNRIIDPCSFP